MDSPSRLEEFPLLSRHTPAQPARDQEREMRHRSRPTQSSVLSEDHLRSPSDHNGHVQHATITYNTPNGQRTTNARIIVDDPLALGAGIDGIHLHTLAPEAAQARKQSRMGSETRRQASPSDTSPAATTGDGSFTNCIQPSTAGTQNADGTQPGSSTQTSFSRNNTIASVASNIEQNIRMFPFEASAAQPRHQQISDIPSIGDHRPAPSQNGSHSSSAAPAPLATSEYQRIPEIEQSRLPFHGLSLSPPSLRLRNLRNVLPAPIQSSSLSPPPLYTTSVPTLAATTRLSIEACSASGSVSNQQCNPLLRWILSPNAKYHTCADKQLFRHKSGTKSLIPNGPPASVVLPIQPGPLATWDFALSAMVLRNVRYTPGAKFSCISWPVLERQGFTKQESAQGHLEISHVYTPSVILFSTHHDGAENVDVVVLSDEVTSETWANMIQRNQHGWSEHARYDLKLHNIGLEMVDQLETMWEYAGIQQAIQGAVLLEDDALTYYHDPGDWILDDI